MHEYVYVWVSMCLHVHKHAHVGEHTLCEVVWYGVVKQVHHRDPHGARPTHHNVPHEVLHFVGDGPGDQTPQELGLGRGRLQGGGRWGP